MIIFLKDYRKTRTPLGRKRVGYLDRSSFEEDLRSSQWTRVEQLMQSLNISWSQARRLMKHTGDYRSMV